jgi:NMD protein affecting ribosome stability and mRNA decay
MTAGTYLFTCPECGQSKLHYARNRCQVCYDRGRKQQQLHRCAECARLTPPVAKGLCAACYKRQRCAQQRAGTR